MRLADILQLRAVCEPLFREFSTNYLSEPSWVILWHNRNIYIVEMSELNLEQFSYQRKRSIFNDTGPTQKSTAPTSNQSVSKLNHASNSKVEGNSNTENDQDTTIEGNEDWSDQMATLVEMFPSETRLQLVDAITSSSSIEEAVNSVCDNLTANSSSGK